MYLLLKQKAKRSTWFSCHHTLSKWKTSYSFKMTNKMSGNLIKYKIKFLNVNSRESFAPGAYNTMKLYLEKNTWKPLFQPMVIWIPVCYSERNVTFISWEKIGGFHKACLTKSLGLDFFQPPTSAGFGWIPMVLLWTSHKVFMTFSKLYRFGCELYVPSCVGKIFRRLTRISLTSAPTLQIWPDICNGYKYLPALSMLRNLSLPLPLHS